MLYSETRTSLTVTFIVEDVLQLIFFYTDEFARAVKISTGHELSEHLVDTVFNLFDKDGDRRLSQLEFMGVMKDRIQRGFKVDFKRFTFA